MGNTGSFILENEIARPATSDAEVGALLAFANGQDIAIRQSGALIRRWSLWREQPSAEERAAVAELVQGITKNPRGAWRAPGLSVAPGPIELYGELPATDFALLSDGSLRMWLVHMARSIEHKSFLVPRGRGAFSLVLYHRYANVAAVLAWAAMLATDSAQPYAGALRLCKGCHSAYIARRTKKGELANPVYCSPACRKDYHNSAARKG